jgi:hypothetical protein
MGGKYKFPQKIYILQLYIRLLANIKKYQKAYLWLKMDSEIQLLNQLLETEKREKREIKRQNKIKSFINLLFIACIAFSLFKSLHYSYKLALEKLDTPSTIEESAKKSEIESCEYSCGEKWEKCTNTTYKKIFECKSSCDDEDTECEVKCRILTMISSSASCSNNLELCFNKCKEE